MGERTLKLTVPAHRPVKRSTLREILKQAQYTPYNVIEQVMVIYAANNGFIDDYPIDQIQSYEEDLLEYLKASHGALMETISTAGKITDDTEAALKKALDAFAEVFDPKKD